VAVEQGEETQSLVLVITAVLVAVVLVLLGKTLQLLLVDKSILAAAVVAV
jgi:hypothetical protein